MKYVDALYKKMLDLQGQLDKTPSIIIEPDTSLTFLWGRSTWNLPLSFMQLRNYQQAAHDAVFKYGFRKLYFAWSRRLGKEVTSWSILIKYAFLHRCTCVVVYPDSKQGKRVLWEGAMTVGGTTVDFLDFLPPFVDQSKDINHTDKRIDLPNGSTIWLLGSENYDKLRGINPQFVLLAEYAFQDPAALRALRPILAENKGILLVQTTFDGRNHGWKLWEKIKNNKKWFTSFLTADKAVDENGKRFISEEEIQDMRDEGTPEYMIQQEFFMATDGDEGKYYFAKTLALMHKANRILPNLWEVGYPIFTFWDIGVKDPNSIILVQFIQNVPKLVGYLQTTGQTYEGDVEEVTKWRTLRGLGIGKHFLPHDGGNRTKTNSGKKAITGQEYITSIIGEPCETIERISDRTFGTKLVRAILPSCMIDSVECERLLECIGAHARIYDEKRQVFSDDTRHDWTSHAVKAVQTMCLALKEKRVQNVSMDKVFNYIR